MFFTKKMLSLMTPMFVAFALSILIATSDDWRNSNDILEDLKYSLARGDMSDFNNPEKLHSLSNSITNIFSSTDHEAYSRFKSTLYDVFAGKNPLAHELTLYLDLSEAKFTRLSIDFQSQSITLGGFREIENNTTFTMDSEGMFVDQWDNNLNLFQVANEIDRQSIVSYTISVDTDIIWEGKICRVNDSLQFKDLNRDGLIDESIRSRSPEGDNCNTAMIFEVF